ncbi:hypothetical protein [Prosthecobacter sp.]|uniref:hypothetical protein n=1 Tax=Prosthecobacter sp. TaxID=1965333 RepID=UPI00378387D0
MRPIPFSCLLLLLSAIPLFSQQPAAPDRKLESLLLMPEPKAMRGPYSITLPNSQETVLTCFRESTTALTGVEVHSEESFAKLGLSVESFAARAKSAADKRLLQIKPELIKGDDGKIAYAVYRGESSLYATLLVAPSLPKIFAELFGPEIWVAAPDRHALYVFPANAELLQDFADDLGTRYTGDPYAASCEVFALKAGSEPRVVASFAGYAP